MKKLMSMCQIKSMAYKRILNQFVLEFQLIMKQMGTTYIDCDLMLQEMY